jgi:hypothetical protein
MPRPSLNMVKRYEGTGGQGRRQACLRLLQGAQRFDSGHARHGG